MLLLMVKGTCCGRPRGVLLVSDLMELLAVLPSAEQRWLLLMRFL